MAKASAGHSARENAGSSPKTIGANWLLLIGLAGFAFASFLMFDKHFYFHDVGFRPREIVMRLLHKKQQEELQGLQDAGDTALPRNILLKKIQGCKPADLKYSCGMRVFPFPDSSELSRVERFNLLKEEMHRIDFFTDTSFKAQFFANNLFANKDSLMDIYRSEKSGDTCFGPYRFTYNHDSTRRDLSLLVSDTLWLHDRQFSGKTYDYFIKYSNFGIWVLLMIFQIMACFLIIPISIMNVMQLKNELAEKLAIDPLGLLWDTLTTALSVTAFIIVFYLTGYRKDLVSNEFFMHGYLIINKVYIALTFLSAISCLTGFLHSARMLQKMLKNIGKKAVAHKTLLINRSNLQQHVATSLAAPATGMAAPTAAMTKLNTDIDSSNTEMADLKDEYAKVRKHFTIFFTTSAFLLSMLVLQTGALFSAISSLDLMRYLNAPTGLYFMRADLIYLFGGIFSLLLLIFYIPVKANMINLESMIPDLDMGAQANTGWLNSISGGLRNFSGILAASSPFLISIVQYFVESLGKK